MATGDIYILRTSTVLSHSHGAPALPRCSCTNTVHLHSHGASFFLYVLFLGRLFMSGADLLHPHGALALPRCLFFCLTFCFGPTWVQATTHRGTGPQGEPTPTEGGAGETKSPKKQRFSIYFIRVLPCHLFVFQPAWGMDFTIMGPILM